MSKKDLFYRPARREKCADVCMVVSADNNRSVISMCHKNKKYMKLEAKSIKFLSTADEQSFFDRLNALSCVNDVFGQGFSIIIDTDKSPDDKELRELIALFYRYNVDMKQLRVFLSKSNRIWFKHNRQSYWYKKVFGNR